MRKISLLVFLTFLQQSSASIPPCDCNLLKEPQNVISIPGFLTLSHCDCISLDEKAQYRARDNVEFQTPIMAEKEVEEEVNGGARYCQGNDLYIDPTETFDTIDRAVTDINKDPPTP